MDDIQNLVACNGSNDDIVVLLNLADSNNHGVVDRQVSGVGDLDNDLARLGSITEVGDRVRLDILLEFLGLFPPIYGC